jgi:LPXTG-motif cell wall-anchored protein
MPFANKPWIREVFMFKNKSVEMQNDACAVSVRHKFAQNALKLALAGALCAGMCPAAALALGESDADALTVVAAASVDADDAATDVLPGEQGETNAAQVAEDEQGAECVTSDTFDIAAEVATAEGAELELKSDSVAVAVDPAEDAQAATLLSNLSARYSKGGASAAINTNTVNAAVALGSLGLGSSLDADAILSNFANYKATMGYAPGAGQYGKYIMALNAAGVDCTAVEIDGQVRNLVDEMEALVVAGGLEGDYAVYSAVWVLPVYGQCGLGDSTGVAATVAFDAILAGQGESGLFGGGGYEDLQTTAQAILALNPFISNGQVADAISAAKNALLANQNADGGYPYTLGGQSDADTTANVIAALATQGRDARAVSNTYVAEGGVSALTFLLSKADSDLAGFNAAGSYDEEFTASTALLGLAADAGIKANGGRFDVYVPVAADANTPSADTTPDATDTPEADATDTPAAQETPANSADNAATNSNSGSLAKTGDATTRTLGALALCAAASLAGALAIRKKRACATVAAHAKHAK